MGDAFINCFLSLFGHWRRFIRTRRGGGGVTGGRYQMDYEAWIADAAIAGSDHLDFMSV